MDFMMDELRKICHIEPLGEKILIVDSHYIGNQIIEAYTAKERLVVNLHYKTVNDLAIELLSSKASFQEEIAEKTVTEYLIYRILSRLKEDSQLHYFNDIEMTAAFCKSMHDTVMQLRLAGYDAATLHTSAFLAEAKGNDFRTILAHYEQALYERKLLDQASIFQQALQLVSKNNKSLYILQSNLQLTYLEHTFLEKLLPEKKYKLSLAKVYGINLPENSSIESIKWGLPTPLSFIYCPDKQPEPLEKVKVHIAKTEELEIKAVFQHLKNNKTSLDNSIIYYSNTEPYTSVIYQICQKLNIPITFADGVPVVYSRPGKLVVGLLDWVQSNYHVEAFISLIFEGLLSVPSKLRTVKILRDLQIGWGKERYIPIIEGALEQLKEEEENDALSAKSNDLHYLEVWFREVLNALPGSNEEISYKNLLMGIRSILSNQSAIMTDLDVIAKKEMEQKVDALIPYLEDEKISLYDAVERTSDLLITSRINASGPKPGYLHAASYEDGIYNQRKYVFFVGLDNQRFPGKSMEDPLLLDSERASLQREFQLLREQSEKRLYNILQAIAHCSGQVTASYCNFDVTNNRALNPSYLFLQLYRAANGNNLVNFKDIKALHTPLYSENALEDFDVWARKFADENIYSAQNGLLDKYPNLINGLHAEQMRDSEQFTAYDGKVAMNQSDSLYKEQTFSASKLEMLAACPYSYFLSEVLKLKPIETVEFDANKWLDAKTRGSLLHKIFELFLKKLKENREKPIYLKHQKLLLKIAQSAIDEERQRTAPPNERVYQNEVSDILHCCDIFLKEEEVFYAKHEPVAFEYTFGMKGEKPAVLTLTNGDTALVSGKIDRIDLNQAGNKHIIDYKTGSTYGYKERNAFNGGRQLQHVIYALAIEQHLQLEAGTVTESSYYFPSAKGNGERIMFKQTSDLREDGIDILTKLIEIMKQGDFTMTDDIEDCRYCSFKTVCKRDSYQTETFNKKLSGLESFKEVRGYD